MSATGTISNLTSGSSGLYFDCTGAGCDTGINAWVQTNSDIATGLTANTQYTFQVKARNGDGDETSYSSTGSKYTLSTTPNVSADKSVSTWYPASTTFTFTNDAGFGAGGVQYYRYVWDTNSTHSFNDTETQWTTGTLAQSPSSSGSYYLHVKAFNNEDAANGTVDYGPYQIDVDSPVIASPTSSDSSDYIYTNGTSIHYGDDMGSAQSFSVSGTASDSGGSGLSQATFTSTCLGSPGADASPAAWSGTYSDVNTDDTCSGATLITVTVADTAGNSDTQTYSVTRDTTNPSIDTGPTLSESSDYLHTSGTTLYYGDDMGSAQSFSVSGTGSDGSAGVWKSTFTSSCLGTPADDTSPASWSGTYNDVASDDTCTDTHTITLYDNVSNTATTTFSVTRDTTNPTGTGSAAADSTTQITWTVSSAADASSGLPSSPHSFDNAVSYQAGNTKAQTSLTANTQYSKTLVIKDNVSNTNNLGAVSKYTLSVTPNVSADQNTSEDIYIGNSATFTNDAGFGGGGVEYYRYVWDTNASHTFADTETQWLSSTLSQTPTTPGNYYLHTKSFNGDDVANGTQSYGPYQFIGGRITNLPSGFSAVLVSAENTDITTTYQGGATNILIKKSTTKVTETSVTFNADKDWSSLSGDTDTTNYKAFVDFSGVTGAASTHTLYIPGSSSSKNVRVCPNATSLAQVTLACTGGYNLSDGGSQGSVSVSYVSASDLWKIQGLSSTGGIENTAPSVPTLVSPSASANSNDNTPTLEATFSDPDSGDTGTLSFEIDTTTSFNSSDKQTCSSSSGITNGSNGSCTISTALDDGTWYWRSQAEDQGGLTSGWTSARTLTIDTIVPVDFDLQDPGDKNYTNNTSPSFSFKKSSDALSGLSKYQLIIDEGKEGSFTIDDIPTSGGSDYLEETTSFKATYENETDSDSTNDVIKIEIKGEITRTAEGQVKAVWPLKEGKRSWLVKAFDNAGNTKTSSRILNVDLTAPFLSELAIADEQLIVGGGSYATNLSRPAFSGKVIDYFNGEKIAENNKDKEASGPEKVEIQIEKEKLGIYSTYLSGSVNVEDKSETTGGTTSEKNGRFYYALTQDLPDGRYKIKLKGKDTAGNKRETIINLRVGLLEKILTPEEKEKLIEKIAEEEKVSKEEAEKIIKEKGIIVPDLLKVPSIIAEGIGKVLGQASKVWWILVESGRETISTRVAVLAQLGNRLLILQDRVLETEDNLRQKAVEIANRLPQPLKLLAKANLELKQKVEGGINKTNKAARYALHSVFAPATKELESFAQRVNIASSTFVAILFDQNPTRITDTRVEEVSSTRAIIIWKTNHFATSKVNYGFSTTYGKEVYSAERVKEHRIVLSDLEPGKTYYFEVMSQNKNYAFDAYYTLTTPVSKEAKVKGAVAGKVLATIAGEEGSWVSVRERPSLRGKIVAKVSAGQSYPLLEEKNGWVKIKLDSQEGWVFGKLIKKN